MVLVLNEGFGFLDARCEVNYLKKKWRKNIQELHKKVAALSPLLVIFQMSPSTVPPNKSRRTNTPTTSTPDAGEGQSEMDNSSPTARRKSWRRATITRRSLPALPHPYQVLSRSISASLPQQERLEKLMEASMKMAIERTQNWLQSVPNSSLESFQKQVEHMEKDWGHLTKSIRKEPGNDELSAKAASDPAVHRAREKFQKAINKLQAESESWEALLNKHRSKAEELEKKVEQGQEGGISLDSASVAQSSQYHCIQSKPDYNALLCRQQPMLHTMTMIMDTQSKMVKELLSIKEQSQLLVKETSGRLAAEAGVQDISPDFIRNFMAAPLPSTTT
ncbi:Kinetochore-associated protein DSN1 like [Dissostichus eleginoides]|uniref:Kinetochore-associated protein DSN1 like n=1 Tax=Dissostichus eleginoides TaxID=100907 RepID=A0AAD9EU37_DISEL|nr:Kinetochore-associated protein DSN1 like [Dissostichus eleginoides]